MAMDQELKRKWVEALRSGEYVQGTGSYEWQNTFCCLGVLCKVAGQPTHNEEGIAGNWVFARAQLDRPDPTLPDITMQLALMNDGGSDFPEIADYIEANL